MTDKMTRWGIGPKFTLLSIIYSILTLVLSRYFDPLFRISFIPYWMLATIGIILILIGISFDIVAIVTVMRAFNKGTLITKGIFGICRHPVYAGWVVFIVPGIVLLVNSWIALSIPLVMYFFLRILVIKEDTYLEKTFGNEYHIYKKRIPAVLPIGWIK